MGYRSIATLLVLAAGSASAFGAGRASDRIGQCLSLQAGDAALLTVSESAPVRFVTRPGAEELQGKMIVRPITRADWLARGASVQDADAHIARARARLAPIESRFVEVHNHILVTLPAGVDENQMSGFLMATDEYQYAEPDYFVFPATVPNDSQYTNFGMYAHQVCFSEPAWNITTGSSAVIIAVTDTGVRLDHEDLAPNLVSGANSATGIAVAQADGGQVDDLNGHGTHCTGIACARGNNGVGVAGMAWGSKIMPIRVSDFLSGGTSLSAVQAGATWAAEHGARIVNTSFSGVEHASNQTVGLTLRTSYNALWFWAAGNLNTDLGADIYPDVQIVASTDDQNQRSPTSNYGDALDIAAPGSGIYSTYFNFSSNYATLSGTSMACPAAAGAAGLILSVNAGFSATQVRDILFDNVDDLGVAGEDQLFGRGRINVGRAVADAYRISFPTTLPFSDNFDSGVFANSNWAYYDTLVTNSTNALAEPSGTRSADLTTARRLESNAINLTGNSSNLILSFATESRGVESGETMVVEYLNSSNAWVLLATYTSNGISESAFTSRSITIPTGASVRHNKFAFRFRVPGTALDTTDHWYVDSVVLASPCPADFNSDGTSDFNDYLDFVDAFSAGSPIADFNHDSVIDFNDYLDFVDALSIGC